MEIGLKIREIRISKGIKQEEIAYFLDIHQGTYAKLENGRLAIKTEQLINIAGYLKVCVTDFLGSNLQLQQTHHHKILELEKDLSKKDVLINLLLQKIQELENKLHPL